MAAPTTRREIRRFMERQRGVEGIYRNSFSRIQIVQIEAVKLEEEQKQKRERLARDRKAV